jgi:hypothetical protein
MDLGRDGWMGMVMAAGDVCGLVVGGRGAGLGRGGSTPPDWLGGPGCLARLWAVFAETLEKIFAMNNP